MKSLFVGRLKQSILGKVTEKGRRRMGVASAGRSGGLAIARRWNRPRWGAGALVLLLAAAGGSGASPAPPAPRPLFRDFMGLNGHTVLFRPELYRPVASLARDYHPAEWDLGKDTSSEPPFPFARNRVNWASVYGSWRKAGWRIDASVMFESLPRDRWRDLASDSRAYAERLAQAFGPSSTNALLESVEIGNEPGKFSDADYRTVFENMARGFKRGDPRLRVGTCAVTTGKSHDYAKSVDCIAGLEGLYDFLNLHTYAQLEGWPTWRRSYPEDRQLKEYLPDARRLCEWRDAHAPGKEIWITEFGYDATTRQPDSKTEFKRWVGVTELQQARWSVRSWLGFATLPVDRAYLYFFNDEDTPQMHGSSGLTRNFVPKPAFYAVAQLRRILGDYRFERAVLDRPGEVCLYEFTHENDRHRRVWVAWSPTGSGRRAEIDLPTLPGTVEKAERMALSSQPAEPIQLQSGKIALEESPLYLLLRAEDP